MGDVQGLFFLRANAKIIKKKPSFSEGAEQIALELQPADLSLGGISFWPVLALPARHKGRLGEQCPNRVDTRGFRPVGVGLLLKPTLGVAFLKTATGGRGLWGLVPPLRRMGQGKRQVQA